MDFPRSADAAAAACCVVVMAKAPERSKRRLAAEIGERATAAAQHLYDCALEDVEAWPGEVCLAVAAASDGARLERPGRRAMRTIVQPPGNLGERIGRVSAELRAAGRLRQIFIGTDCAELDADYLRRAAVALADHEVVLGPARDGGVVLMAASRPWPPLAELPWSTAELGAALRRLCEAHGLRAALLEERGDIDTLADLIALRAALVRDARPARQALRGWLAAQPECRSV